MSNTSKKLIYRSGGSSGSVVTGEMPTGAINGGNTTFVLAHSANTNTEEIYLNGVRQKSGVDYTMSASNILTFTIAPIAGDLILVDYIY